MFNVVIALGNANWEQEFINNLGHPMFGISIAKRCVDGIDIQATVRTIDVDAVIVADGILRVDGNCIAEVLSAGVRFIAITSSPDEWRQLGVHDLVSYQDHELALLVQQLVIILRDVQDEITVNASAKARFIAVTGFGGASGRSLCALETAQALAKIGTTCLVDGDVYAPSLAQQVGYTDFTGGLLGLTRIAELRKLTDISLHETASTLPSGVIFLRGIPTTQRWTDLRLHALKSMWDYLLSRVDNVIVDCGPAYDLLDRHAEVTAKPTRAITSLTAIDVAETVVVTANATEIGMARLINGYADLHDFISDKEVTVVIHGVTDEKAEREIRVLVARELGITAVVCLQNNSLDYSELIYSISHVEIPEIKTARRGIIRKRAA